MYVRRIKAIMDVSAKWRSGSDVIVTWTAKLDPTIRWHGVVFKPYFIRSVFSRLFHF